MMRSVGALPAVAVASLLPLWISSASRRWPAVSGRVCNCVAAIDQGIGKQLPGSVEDSKVAAVGVRSAAMVAAGSATRAMVVPAGTVIAVARAEVLCGLRSCDGHAGGAEHQQCEQAALHVSAEGR